MFHWGSFAAKRLRTAVVEIYLIAYYLLNSTSAVSKKSFLLLELLISISCLQTTKKASFVKLKFLLELAFAKQIYKYVVGSCYITKLEYNSTEKSPCFLKGMFY